MKDTWKENYWGSFVKRKLLRTFCLIISCFVGFKNRWGLLEFCVLKTSNVVLKFRHHGAMANPFVWEMTFGCLFLINMFFPMKATSFMYFLDLLPHLFLVVCYRVFTEKFSFKTEILYWFCGVTRNWRLSLLLQWIQREESIVPYIQVTRECSL